MTNNELVEAYEKILAFAKAQRDGKQLQLKGNNKWRDYTMSPFCDAEAAADIRIKPEPAEIWRVERFVGDKSGHTCTSLARAESALQIIREEIMNPRDLPTIRHYREVIE